MSDALWLVGPKDLVPARTLSMRVRSRCVCASRVCDGTGETRFENITSDGFGLWDSMILSSTSSNESKSKIPSPSETHALSGGLSSFDPPAPQYKNESRRYVTASRT